MTILLICLILCGCGALHESTDPSLSAEMPDAADSDSAMPDAAVPDAEETDRTEELTEIEAVFREVGTEQTDGTDAVGEIVRKLGEKGYVSVDRLNQTDMTQADRLQDFIESYQSGTHAEVTVLQISELGGFERFDLRTDGGIVQVDRTGYVFREKQFKETFRNEFEADSVSYTEEGYLFLEGRWYSPERYALTLSDETEEVAFRVLPLDETCRSLCAEYLTPDAYGLNDLFITNWDEEDCSSLDFDDLFELFYSETFGGVFPYAMNDDLSERSIYEIPADEYEAVIGQHLKISPEKLHTLPCYEKERESYVYCTRGFDSFDYEEIPYPEVVDYEELDDGSVILYVNAVYPNAKTSKLFSHKVRVTEEDGNVYYLSNETIDINEQDLWWHADRSDSIVPEG